MPTLSERQLLIQNVLLETERDLDEYMAEGQLDDDDMDLDLDHRNESDDDSDISDTSSTSSDSSSSSSDSSGSDASMHSAISDDDEDEVYAAKMSATGELLQAVFVLKIPKAFGRVKALSQREGEGLQSISHAVQPPVFIRAQTRLLSTELVAHRPECHLQQLRRPAAPWLFPPPPSPSPTVLGGLVLFLAAVPLYPVWRDEGASFC
ncbi:hypothetical protein B0H10DRAFT_2123883 [Mycena sp. CBHHK59/15]|nr:hypothetical protein B0H10DRAFT_2123883 [Mycena sp. CBHHK59/15]